MAKLQVDYEAVLVLEPLEGEKKSKTSESIAKSFEKREATIYQKEEWGIKNLFHPVKKINQGDFYFYKFRSVKENIKDLYTDLKLNASTLKIFIKKTSVLKEKTKSKVKSKVKD